MSDFGLLSPTWAASAASSATGDDAYLAAMLDAEAALARAGTRTGLVPAHAADVISTACAEHGRFDTAAIAARAVADGNPVIALVADLRAAVAAADPAAAQWVHHGATSQDIMDTACMLVAARTLAVLDADLAAAGDHAARLAGAHRGTVMAGRTLTQHAVPITFGLKAAGWLAGLLDARDLMARTRAALPAQLGGAAGTLSAVGAHGPALLNAFATETGLADPGIPWHTRRTPMAELATTLATTTGAFGKIAADVALLAHTEIAELAESQPGTSSAMPHKRNPVRAVLIRSAAAQTPALAATVLAAMTGEHERPAGSWHAEWQPLRELLRLTTAAAAHTAALLDGLHVDPTAMAANLRAANGLLIAEHVAAALTPHLGLPAARALVAGLATRTGPRTLRQLLDGVPQVTAVFDAAALDRICDPAAYLGSSESFIDRALARHASGSTT